MRNCVRIAVLLAVILAAACGPGNTAQQILKSPEYRPAGETKCHAGAVSTRPLIVEWPSPARGDLEAIVEDHRSVAVVRYVGCTMTVLPDCSAPGTVTYVPYRNEKQDQLRITSADDLYANLPVGAASLEGKLSRAGELDVDMMLVGQYEADTQTVTPSQLKGRCDGATHIVQRVTVGAFDFHTGANANVGAGVNVMGAGAGGSSSATRENLARDGRVDACGAAKLDDRDPPQNCGALVRLEVVPLGAPQAPSCPDGSQWSGSACVRTNVVTEVQCPPGTNWDGGKCAASVDTSCDSGMHFQAGRGCVADPPMPADCASAYQATVAALNDTDRVASVERIKRQLAIAGASPDKACADRSIALATEYALACDAEFCGSERTVNGKMTRWPGTHNLLTQNASNSLYAAVTQQLLARDYEIARRLNLVSFPGLDADGAATPSLLPGGGDLHAALAACRLCPSSEASRLRANLCANGHPWACGCPNPAP